MKLKNKWLIALIVILAVAGVIMISPANVARVMVHVLLGLGIFVIGAFAMCVLIGLSLSLLENNHTD